MWQNATMPTDPAAPVTVYYVTGDDDLDDPAWGIEPMFRGTWAEMLAWLPHQAEKHRLCIYTPEGHVWGSDVVLGE